MRNNLNHLVLGVIRNQKITPSYTASTRTGYHLFLSKIQMISKILSADERDLTYLHQKWFKRVYNARKCFPDVQTLLLTPI